MNLDGTEFKTLPRTDGETECGKLSPDGKRVLYDGFTPPKEKQAEARSGLFVLDLATGRSMPVADLPLNGEIGSFCWSPDGKRIAYTWRQVHEGVKKEELGEKETESHLVVCDPDGKNQRTIASEKARGQWVITIAGVDWR
jgi:dipeptidyl aminopeptidase/acylaminoacyl peptidase